MTKVTIEEMVQGLTLVTDLEELFDDDLGEKGDIVLQTHLVEFVSFGSGRISMSVTKLFQPVCNWSELGSGYDEKDETSVYLIDSLEDGYKRVMNYMIANADSVV